MAIPLLRALWDRLFQKEEFWGGLGWFLGPVCLPDCLYGIHVCETGPPDRGLV